MSINIIEFAALALMLARLPRSIFEYLYMLWKPGTFGGLPHGWLRSFIVSAFYINRVIYIYTVFYVYDKSLGIIKKTW